MQIPKDVLAEKNYEGSRLVEVTDETVINLKKEIAKYKPVAAPFLTKMDELARVLDPFYTKIREHQTEIDKVKKEMQQTKESFEEVQKEMESIEQKTDLIKNKIQPIIAKLMEGQLGEFETARQLIEKDEKLFVEIICEIEEKVKAIRANKKK